MDGSTRNSSKTTVSYPYVAEPISAESEGCGKLKSNERVGKRDHYKSPIKVRVLICTSILFSSVDIENGGPRIWWAVTNWKAVWTWWIGWERKSPSLVCLSVCSSPDFLSYLAGREGDHIILHYDPHIYGMWVLFGSFFMLSPASNDYI